MTKRKVLHIGQPTGGVKTYIALAIEHCNREKFDFVVIAAPNEIFEDFCKKHIVPYYPADLLRGGNIFKTIAVVIKLIRIIVRERPNIIHLHSAKAGFLGRIAARIAGRCCVIYSPHAFSYLSFTGIKRVIFYLLELIAKKWTDILLAISYSESEKAIYEVGYKPYKVKMILNSIAIPHNPMIGHELPCVNIRMIGRLTIQKNPLLFLEIANKMSGRYPQLKFSILGAGIHDHLSEQITDYIFENNLSQFVTIEQWGDAGTSSQFLAGADIYVSTSIFEGLPYSLLEAMSLNVPCVVSAVAGNIDVVRNFENGFTCLSLEDFCEKLELLIHNIGLRNKLSRAGVSYVYRYHNIKSSVLELEKLYDNI